MLPRPHLLAHGLPALASVPSHPNPAAGHPPSGRGLPRRAGQPVANKPAPAKGPSGRVLSGLVAGLAACLAVSLAACAPARAAAPDCTHLPTSVLFEQRTWTEIQEGLGCGVRTVIIPVGGTEQSGPYIAVGKHNVRVMAQAERIARTVGDTLVAPVMAYVPEGGTKPRTSHMRFAGTLSIPPDVFEKLVLSAAESLRVQGFSLVVLLGDHGGYQTQLRQAADTLNTTWRGTGAKALYVRDYYDVLPHQYADWLRKNGHAGEVGLHAELSDTALMLAVDPAMVRQQALHAGPPPSAAQGIYGGDPRGATAALGQPGLDMQVRAATQAIEAARAHQP